MRRLLWLALLIPVPASAHLVSTRFGEFYAGMLHPVTTLGHLVPWLAVGLLAGLQHSALARKVLLLFPLAVLAGTWMGSELNTAAWVGIVNQSSLLILGLLVVLARPLPPAVFSGVVMIYGLSHGLGNGATDLSGNGLLLYVLGVTTAAYLLVTLLTASSHQLVTRQSWGTVAIRAGGSWIAAVGLIYLTFTLLAAP